MSETASGTLEVPISRVHPQAQLPQYAHADDAGADLCVTAAVRIEPGQRVLVGTGVAVAVPPGYAGFVHPRSGLAARTGLSVVNTPGTIDAGYRGEIKVCLINHDLTDAIELAAGDRIAQLVVAPVVRAHFVRVDDVAVQSSSERGAGGYGSTGGHASLIAEHPSPNGS